MYVDLFSGSMTMHTPPMEGYWKFGGEGSQKPKFLKESKKAKLEFSEGWGKVV